MYQAWALDAIRTKASQDTMPGNLNSRTESLVVSKYARGLPQKKSGGLREEDERREERR